MLWASAFTENLLQPKENKDEISTGTATRKENRERFLELCTLFTQKREMLDSEANIACFISGRVSGDEAEVTPVMRLKGNHVDRATNSLGTSK